MMGRAWTRQDIDRLAETFEGNGDTLALSTELDRTHEAVLAKANRLGLKRRSAAAVQQEARSAVSG